MSVTIKLGVCIDCKNKRFKLSDATGAFNATWNTGGWGGDNTITTTDVEVSTLKIISPLGNEYGPYDVSSYIPSLDEDNFFYIDPTDILDEEEGESLTDGEWTFVWMVQGVYGDDDTPFNLRCVATSLSTCDAELCVDRLNSDMDPNCGCNDTGTSKALKAHLTLEAIKSAYCCGKKEQAKTLLTKLQDICNNNCKNC